MFTVDHLGKGSSYPPLITLRYKGEKYSENMSVLFCMYSPQNLKKVLSCGSNSHGKKRSKKLQHLKYWIGDIQNNTQYNPQKHY